ncbi:MAG TPA: Ppx/GppA phosphatase family protein [Candidatus Didemnitutus sp.]|nr:Ppx/GppA phosphatase family protein [Candidatus Didemnitutus sp.]
MAGIDIGTNTALMVVARVANDGTSTPIDDVYEVPRLGEGLDASGFISEASLQRAEQAMTHFRTVLLTHSHAKVHAVATSAMREASNGADVQRRLENALGHPITIINGDEEARLTFLGAVGTRPKHTLMIDIGGGSTEYAVGINGTVTGAVSTSIGAVRLTERYAVDRPLSPVVRDNAREYVRAQISHLVQQYGPIEHVVGVAGTPTALAMIDLGLESFDPARVDGHTMSTIRVGEITEWLCSQTLDELRSIPGLHERRADIVPIGALILHTSLESFGCESVECTIRGLRFGAMLTASL